MMRKVLTACCLFACLCVTLGASEPKRWAIYYSDVPLFGQFAPYSVLVFDADAHPPLAEFAGQDKALLGYLSLGEIRESHPYFQTAKDAGLLQGENSNWKGSYFVDMRDPLWAKQLLEQSIPAILQQRFTGLFLDTLDDAAYLENKDPTKYKGMRDAAVKLVKAIRLHYPQIVIMQNRGYELMPEVAGEIDMLLAESLYTTYDTLEKKYRRVPDAEYKIQLDKLLAAKVLNPHLQLYSLDYWQPKDKDVLREIYDVERSHALIPYVSTVELNQLVPEPQ